MHPIGEAEYVQISLTCYQYSCEVSVCHPEDAHSQSSLQPWFMCILKISPSIQHSHCSLRMEDLCSWQHVSVLVAHLFSPLPLHLSFHPWHISGVEVILIQSKACCLTPLATWTESISATWPVLVAMGIMWPMYMYGVVNAVCAECSLTKIDPYVKGEWPRENVSWPGLTCNHHTKCSMGRTCIV